MSKETNTGNYNTGNCNTGNCNTGNCNTGNCNTGNYNTGYCNTGNYNTGYCNTGNYNTGYRNTGYRNTGNYNTGYYNTGNCNTGNCNTGNCNTGNCNTGYRNTGNYNTGDCNTNNPSVRMFNHDSGIEFFSEKHNRFRDIINSKSRPLCEWVSESNMSDGEKEKWKTYKTTGGYLKVNENLFNRKDVTEEEREFLESLPNFDADILLECTGIDITNKKKTIIIDGKSIQISKESWEELKKSFID